MGKKATSGDHGGKKPVVKVIASAAALAAIVGAVWFSGLVGHLSGHSTKTTRNAVTEAPTFVDVPDIVSNLDTGSRHASFIKLHAKLEIAHATDAGVLQADLPRILDVFQSYLRSTRPEELRGGEGTYRLREALMNRVDAVVAPVQLTDILFTEVLVQ